MLTCRRAATLITPASPALLFAEIELARQALGFLDLPEGASMPDAASRSRIESRCLMQQGRLGVLEMPARVTEVVVETPRPSESEAPPQDPVAASRLRAPSELAAANRAPSKAEPKADNPAR